MKIIQPSPSTKKTNSSSTSDHRGTKVDGLIDREIMGALTKASELNTKPRKSKKKPYCTPKSHIEFSSNDSQRSTEHLGSGKEFGFHTTNLEDVPKDEVPYALPEGKKRRRSELVVENIGEPLLITDPVKKEFNELFARCVRLLAMREHSVREITNKLFDKSENADVIHAVIDELLKKKYLSDERFTESYIRTRSNRGFGPVKIKVELKNKGISNNLIQDYLDQGAAIWFDNAQFQYQKKYGNAPIVDYNAWTKRARFLQSRGFTSEQIRSSIPDLPVI